MMDSSEAIGLGICVTAATALISYLIYLKATSQGHSGWATWRGLAAIWLCLGTAVAVLMRARSVAEGPLLDFSLGQDGPQWWVGGRRQLGVGVAAAALLVGLLWLALRIAQRLQEPAASPDTKERNTNKTNSS